MSIKRKPDWMRVRISNTSHLNKVNNLVKSLGLNTVCEAANCPNRLECFSNKTATFMILGNICTRACKFCNVTGGEPEKINSLEPGNIAKAVDELGLEHAVITSVTRDDLVDQGANQFAEVIKEIRFIEKNVSVEVLTPDFNNNYELIKIVVDARPDVYNHNIETVKRLYDTVRPEANYEQSLEVLRNIKKIDKNMTTKSGIMLGLGEKHVEVVETLKDLRESGCDIVTIGQYLQPSKEHIEMVEYVHPDKFKEYEAIAISLGFSAVASSPLVRSSYKALESYKKI